MEEQPEFQLIAPQAGGSALAVPNAAASPFKIVVDPKMRMLLRKALVDLIDHHDEALAAHFADGRLALESYKEYIELFARSLRETMETREGIAYLLKSAGFDLEPSVINLAPEWRWQKASSATEPVA